MGRRVLLYEINEVPWEIWDLYVAARPKSNFAGLMADAMQRTTVDEDTVELQPWRSWTTLHRSMYSKDHRSLDLGQDPTSFMGTPLWDVVDASDLPVGLFGVLQSWPPHPFRAGGFFVPDSFARDSKTIPASLERFQSFNTSMTSENSFTSTDRLAPTRVATAALDLLAKGISPWSTYEVIRHLGHEARDDRFKAARPIVQVLPCFDVFWKLHRRFAPALSIFFTNHVASMMHRFWGDWVPDYQSNGYAADEIFRRFILQALDFFDHQLGVMKAWVDRNDETVLILAGAIGQGPIQYHPTNESYVLEHPDRLAAALGLHGPRAGIAMYPRVSLEFPDGSELPAAWVAFESAKGNLGPMFSDLRIFGSTLAVEVAQYPGSDDPLSREVSWSMLDGTARQGTIDDLGIVIRQRPGGGNTAHHIPDGAFLAYGKGIAPDPSREKSSILDVAPSLLGLLGLCPSPDMQGEPSVFAQE
ncbi:MAG TPA: hypothetical protein VNG12_16845 [Acidimicrobiales bacterium]|nr:hypothetical protein [Acidimicrobiales bacterium]